MITIRDQIEMAMKDPDQFVLNLIYIAHTKVSARVVSPIQWVSTRRFQAFDLCREVLRCFRVNQIHRCALVDANLVSAGHPIIEKVFLKC